MSTEWIGTSQSAMSNVSMVNVCQLRGASRRLHTYQ